MLIQVCDNHVVCVIKCRCPADAYEIFVNNSQSYHVKCVLTGNEGRASESSGGVIVDLQQNNSKQASNFHCKSVYRQLGLQAFHRLSF